jgi:hypothetical protein
MIRRDRRIRSGSVCRSPDRAIARRDTKLAERLRGARWPSPVRLALSKCRCAGFQRSAYAPSALIKVVVA